MYNPSDDTWTSVSIIPRDVIYAASAYHGGWGLIMSGGVLANEVTITKNAAEFEEHILPMTIVLLGLMIQQYL